MRFIILLALAVTYCACSSFAGTAASLSRPVPAVGPGRLTLVIYDALAKPFSLENELAPITLVLSRFDTKVVTRQAKKVTEADIRTADFIVAVGICGIPEWSRSVGAELARTNKPLIGIGWASVLAGAAKPDRVPDVVGAATVHYRGLDRKVRLDPYFPGPKKSTQVLAELAGSHQPLCWRSGSRLGFGALPGTSSLSHIFSDILLDFYAVAAPSSAGLMFVVQNFNPGSDPAALRRLVDYLYAHGSRFVLTTQLDDVPGDAATWMSRKSFFETLRYAQSHGAQVMLRGNAGARPPRSFSESGVLPIGWELPDRGGQELSSAISGETSGLLVGSLLLGTPAHPSPFAADTLMFSLAGRPVIPLNVQPFTTTPESTRMVAEQVKQIASLREGIAGVAIPAWFAFQQMRDVVDAALTSGMPILSIEGSSLK